MADILIGNVKGPQGAQGAQGVQGEQGEAATIEVGSVTTVPYGQTASVVNSGTESEAILDFTIPQGRPGEQVTDMQNLTLSSMTTSSASFPIPAIGETGKVIFGKIVKWFSDMSALVATKLNASNVVNNLTTTDSGYALDARQGKVLNDRISEDTTKVRVITPEGVYVNNIPAGGDVVEDIYDINTMIGQGYSFIGFIPSSSGDYILLSYRLSGTFIRVSAHNSYSQAQSVTIGGHAMFIKQNS